METNINFDHISLSSSQKEECFSQVFQRKSKCTFSVQYCFLNSAFCEIRWKITVERERPQMTI